MILERRADEGQANRAPALIAELIDRRVDILVFATAFAAMDATSTVPIVLNLADPVGQGFVACSTRRQRHRRDQLQ
jgi:hypothetical protein